jgi:hypothetical protein
MNLRSKDDIKKSSERPAVPIFRSRQYHSWSSGLSREYPLNRSKYFRGIRIKIWSSGPVCFHRGRFARSLCLYSYSRVQFVLKTAHVCTLPPKCSRLQW